MVKLALTIPVQHVTVLYQFQLLIITDSLLILLPDSIEGQKLSKIWTVFFQGRWNRMQLGSRIRYTHLFECLCYRMVTR